MAPPLLSLPLSPTGQLVQRFRRNGVAVASLWFIGLCVVLAVLAPFVSPDGSPDANEQLHPAAYCPPGTTLPVLVVPNGNPTPTLWQRWLSTGPMPCTRTPLATLAEDATHHTIIRSLPVALPLPKGAHVEHRTYWLGGDALGRDVLSRLLLGLRISLAIGFAAVALGTAIGVALGALAGYFGRWVDATVLFLMNVLWAVPSLLLVVALSLTLGRGLGALFVAVGLSMWVDVARMVRTQVASLKTRPWAEAARLIGFGHGRTLMGHILPNALGPVAILVAGNFASAILVESGLSFLGVGVQPPTPSLGGMVRDGYAAALFGAPHLTLAPGGVLVLLVLAFNMVGNALADAVNVKG